MILVRIAAAQQPDPGVLVEFGGHPGGSVVVGDGPLRPQSVGNRGRDLDTQPYPFVGHRGRQPLQAKLLGNPHTRGQALHR